MSEIVKKLGHERQDAIMDMAQIAVQAIKSISSEPIKEDGDIKPSHRRRVSVSSGNGKTLHMLEADILAYRTEENLDLSRVYRTPKTSNKKEDIGKYTSNYNAECEVKERY